jgi:type I restriction enzyme, S subunit
MESDGWQTFRLGDVTENFDFKRVPVKEADRRPGPYPYYGASGVVDHVDQYIFDGEYLLIAEDGENLRSRKLPIAFIATGRFWVNNHAHIVQGNGLANTRFLGYCLNHMDITGYLSGSTMPKFTQSNMNRIGVRLPPKPVQDGIVDFVLSIDHKLELNRRMNRTLERLAAAIFKSWFIDFDPVRRNVARMGNQPVPPAPLPAGEAMGAGSVEDLDRLFPDSFEDSPLGPIPKGWKVGPLSLLASLQTRTIQPGKQPDVRWEHYSIPAYDEGQQPKRELGETIKSGKYAVLEGSVLVSKLNPQFPRIWLPWVDDANLAICSTEFMPFVPCQDSWRAFLYQMMKSQPVQDSIKAQITGSTGSRQRVKPTEIAHLPIVIPTDGIIDSFCGLLSPHHQKILLNRRQNLRLAGLRDALLPKLLSGEIELPETLSAAADAHSDESIAEEVA